MPWLRSLMLVVLIGAPVLAADWPQWLGPNRDGTSSEKIKPWKDKLEVVWKKGVPPGHSSPVVVKGKVYLHVRGKDKDKEEEGLLCFDAKSGKELWYKAYSREKFSSPFGTGPQATPAVVGGKVYTYGATGVLTCFDAEKGDTLWQLDTWNQYDVTRDNKRWLFFGAASSPLIDGDNVVVNVGGKGASVVAFSRDKGEEVWKSLDDKASYSSGVALGKGDKRELVFLTAEGVRGLAPKDGKKLWEFALKDRLQESATTPVKAGDLILAASITKGMSGLKLEEKEGKYVVKEAWKNPKLTCYFSTPIPVGKHVYVVTGQLALFPNSTLHCVEIESGKILWSKEKVGKWHAAMLKTADDKLLLLSDNGRLALFEPNEKEYKELASAQLAKGEQIWAHPALANGKVYFRDDKSLICLQMPE
jgi:outer membrane protein assembly factor BamB